MSRIACDIVKDLIPLYIDDVCSEESKHLVEDHIKECDSCKALYESMKEDIVAPNVSNDDDTVKRLMSSVNNKLEKRNTIVKCVCIGICAVLILAGIILTLPIVPLKPNKGYEVKYDTRAIIHNGIDGQLYEYNANAWNEMTIYIYPSDGALDDYKYGSFFMPGYNEYTFAIADEYIKEDGSDLNMTVVSLQSDKDIKKYNVKLKSADNEEVITIKNVKTSIIGSALDDSKSVVDLFYFVESPKVVME